MNETYVLQLSFVTNTNEEIRINIPYADPTLTTTIARGYMENLIDAAIVVTTQGMPVKSNSAVLIKTAVDALTIS